MATVKPDYTHPPTPRCCGLPMVPFAHDTGDGWAWGWECAADCESEAIYATEWPFNEPTATGRDWKKLDFPLI